MINGFWGKTIIISSEVSIYIFVECLPVEFSGYQLTGFIDTKIASQLIIVMSINQFFSNNF